MSDISVTVTSPGAVTGVSVASGSTVSATVGNGGSVSVSLGSIAPSSPTVVSGTLQIGKVTTLAAGAQATATNVGTSYAAIIDLGLPAGATGPAGKDGADGQDGITPAFSIGTVTTGDPGTNAAVTATTTDGGSKVALAFTIPRGDTGATGSGGGSSVSLSDATPSALGTAQAGTSSLASRSDHTHALPTASALGLATVASSGAYADLSGTPTVPAMSDSTPAALGAATPGVSLDAARADHVHQMPSAADVFALAVDDPVDGGEYVGVVITPVPVTPTITVLAQPQSATATVAIGSSWQSVGVSDTYWRDIAYGNGRFVLVGARFNAGANRYQTAASANGSTWSYSATSASGAPARPLYRLIAGHAYSGTGIQEFLAVGGDSTNGEYSMRSQNGMAWGFPSSMPSGTTSGIAYGNGLYVGVGSSTTTAAVSDILAWSDPVTPPASLRRVAYGGGAFVAIPSSTSSTAYRTTDGTAWSSVSLPSSKSWAEVAYGGGKFVAVASGTVAYSSDGVNWSLGTIPSGSWTGLTYAGSQWWAFKFNSTSAAKSSDGITWMAVTLPVSGYWSAAAGNSTSIVAMNKQSSGYQHLFSQSSPTASFAVSAVLSPSGTLGYQWQLSTDSGSTWSAISGQTSSTLSLTGLTSGDSGKQYRCVISASGATSVNTDAAILTVS